MRLFLRCYDIADFSEIQRQRIEDFEASFGPPIGSCQLKLFDFSHLEGMYDKGWPLGDMGAHGFGEFDYPKGDFRALLKNSLLENWSDHKEALFQHYGMPSVALDVSADPIVALWFATHKLIRETDGRVSYKHSEHSDSVVYVFSPDDATIKSVAAISIHPDESTERTIPHFGLRGVIQQGGLVFGATGDPPDMRRYVSHQLHLDPSIWSETKYGNRYCAARLFPPPDIDPFYKALLKLCSDKHSDYYALQRYVTIYA